jgi:acyl-coenzyme A thioesterase PaaI-like protein
LTQHTPTLDEQSSHCFGCSPNNPQGLHLVFTLHAEDPAHITATAQVTIGPLHEGAPGHVHGGIIATVMDEAMSKLNRPLNALAMTRNLNVDYLKPWPIGETLTLTSRHLRREGRKLFHAAQLTRPDGTVVATATSLFIVIDPKHLQAALGQPEP